MRVLVIGSGAREHALVWKISRSPLVRKLFCAPGNPGTGTLAENHPVSIEDPQSVLALARRLDASLVVIGPEAALVAGVADVLRANSIAVFGPNQAAAALEGSKAFAKEIMSQAKVPTAAARTFTDPLAAEAYARTLPSGVVVKADGLAAGKGVVVAHSSDEAVAAIQALSRLGDSAQTLVLEEILEGEEVSVIALCDSERFVLLPPAQDHKRVGEGDAGPNTGGMGAYVPVPFFDDAAMEKLGREVIAPVLQVMRARGTPFSGALFAGLMLTSSGPKVLEFNCRFGDPETQVLMMQLEEDVLPLLWMCAQGALDPCALKLHAGASVGVVIAGEGYPGMVRTGDAIELPAEVGAAQVFHAGTRLEGGQLVTAGGRILTVCARGGTLAEARANAYAQVERVRIRGSHYRRDIGSKGLRA